MSAASALSTSRSSRPPVQSEHSDLTGQCGGRTFVLDVLPNLVCHGRVKTLFVRHLLLDVRPRHLVELVDRGRDRPDLFWRYTAHFEDAVQDSAVVQLWTHVNLALPRARRRPTYLDGELAHIQSRQDCANQTDDLGVGNHDVKRASNIEVLYQVPMSTPRFCHNPSKSRILTACENSRIRPLLMTGLSLLYTFPTCQSFA